MKTILYVITLLGLLYYAQPHMCQRFPDIWPFCPETKTEAVYVLAEEKYGVHLRAVADHIMGPLETKSPNPVSSLSRMSGVVEADVSNNLLDAEQGSVIQRLCRSLEMLNQERENFEREMKTIQERDFATFGTAKDREDKRQFFINDINRRWLAVVERNRPGIMNDLKAIRSFERTKEAELAR